MKQMMKSGLSLILALMLMLGGGVAFADGAVQNANESSSGANKNSVASQSIKFERATAADSVAAEEQLMQEQQELPAELPDDPPTAERSVSIRRVMPDIIRDGDPFWLEATLVGFEDVSYELQWQYNGEHGWQDMPDAKGSSVKLTADRDNVNYDWRILVNLA